MIDQETADAIVGRLNEATSRGAEWRREAMRELDRLEAYDWSGVYRLVGDELVLDAYVGESTEHDRIPVGRGVCGTAVAENRNQVIDDVRELSNYLSCSVHTRSEIVVLVRDPEGKILGQIDIDGHQTRAFDATDEAMLKKIAELMAERWA